MDIFRLSSYPTLFYRPLQYPRHMGGASFPTAAVKVGLVTYLWMPGSASITRPFATLILSMRLINSQPCVSTVTLVGSSPSDRSAQLFFCHTPETRPHLIRQNTSPLFPILRNKYPPKFTLYSKIPPVPKIPSTCSQIYIRKY